MKSDQPKSMAPFESLGAAAGMLLGLSIGITLVRFAIPYGWPAVTAAGGVAIFMFFAAMIGLSILGGSTRR